MAFSTRTLSGHLRQGSTSSNNPGSQPVGQSAALLARVNEKKAELENLKQLRELSAAMADQMEALQQKLATLSDGTEGARSRGCGDQTRYHPVSMLTRVLLQQLRPWWATGTTSCRPSTWHRVWLTGSPGIVLHVRQILTATQHTYPVRARQRAAHRMRQLLRCHCLRL